MKVEYKIETIDSPINIMEFLEYFKEVFRFYAIVGCLPVMWAKKSKWRLILLILQLICFALMFVVGWD